VGEIERDAALAAIDAAAADEIAGAAAEEAAAIAARSSPLEPDGLRLSNSAPPTTTTGSSSSHAARGSRDTPDPPVRSATVRSTTSPATPSAFEGLDVSAIVQEQVRQLDIPFLLLFRPVPRRML
jgi:hypothetical protein